MSRPQRFSLLQAFGCALRGARLMAAGRNGRLQLAVAIVAIALGTVFALSAIEWTIVILAIALVLSLETFNTALERAVDIASPGYNEMARDAKDLAAGAVLIASIGSVAVGLIIYVPRLIRFL